MSPPLQWKTTERGVPFKSCARALWRPKAAVQVQVRDRRPGAAARLLRPHHGPRPGPAELGRGPGLRGAQHRAAPRPDAGRDVAGAHRQAEQEGNCREDRDPAEGGIGPKRSIVFLPGSLFDRTLARSLDLDGTRLPPSSRPPSPRSRPPSTPTPGKRRAPMLTRPA